MDCQRLPNLQPQYYEHPFDKKALDALEGTPGLDLAIRKFWEYGLERLLRVQYTGSNFQVTASTMPREYQVFECACEILNLPQRPDLYVAWDYGVNGATTGVENPIIVLHSGAIDLLSEDELLFLLAHEIGHIKSNHVLYHQLAQVLPVAGEIIGAATLGLGGLVATGLNLALLNWQRMSEFTADRAGLLACQDPKVAARTMIKMAGLPKKYFDDDLMSQFLDQAKSFEQLDYSLLDKTAKTLSIMWESHPWTVMRASEFFKWVESGEYDKVLALCQSAGCAGSADFYCQRCGNPWRAGDEFCTNCGAALASIPGSFASNG